MTSSASISTGHARARRPATCTAPPGFLRVPGDCAQSGQLQLRCRFTVQRGIAHDEYGETEHVVQVIRELGDVDVRRDGGARASAIAQFMRAWAAAEYGDFHGARELIRDHLTGELNVPFLIDVALSGIGIPVGLRLLDEELVSMLVKPGALERALSSGTPSNVPFLTLAYAEPYKDRGEHESAAGVLSRALDVICGAPKDGSDHFPFLYVQVAALGYASDLARARERLAYCTENPMFRAARAQLTLFDAYAAERRGAHGERISCGRSAADQFHALCMPYYEALALELSGSPEGALALHRAIGNVRDSRRLERLCREQFSGASSSAAPA